jgi:hypothetical protein
MRSSTHQGWQFVFCVLLAGCGHHAWIARPDTIAVENPQGAIITNPLIVASSDCDFVWNQIVDTVDDYFRIAREERVQAVGGILTAGRMETYPTPGATVLEPWLRDSTPGFERTHSTFQSTRRRSVIHVLPVEQGFSVEVIVFKELEDLDRPEQATLGSGALRHDGSLVRIESNMSAGPTTLGWIQLGRDIALEQRILAEIHGRLADYRALTARRVPGR